MVLNQMPVTALHQLSYKNNKGTESYTWWPFLNKWLQIITSVSNLDAQTSEKQSMKLPKRKRKKKQGRVWLCRKLVQFSTDCILTVSADILTLWHFVILRFISCLIGELFGDLPSPLAWVAFLAPISLCKFVLTMKCFLIFIIYIHIYMHRQHIFKNVITKNQCTKIYWKT